jgi:DNA polymerase-3 subunit epsilon
MATTTTRTTGQRSFDDLGTPLHEVTFCVVDLETTGGSPETCAITEIGAVRLRAGECLGTFQTLVNPRRAIPTNITVLTGITEAMVMPAPTIEDVLPSLLEFVGGCVLVGHNLRFDVSFLDAALRRAGRPPIRLTCIDTCALARRLIRDEVPNCRLGTLASRLRLSHTPTHRALDDALATGDLLHALLERAAAFGVMGLDDLVALPKMGGHPQATKLKLTSRLPRAAGVYLFRDRAGRPLYVGKATDLRSRVRSYFSSDDRRKIGALLRETHAIDHVRCSSSLEATALEARLIGRLLPRYNRHGTRWKQAAYLKLTAEPFPRLSVTRSGRGDGLVELGPLPSARVAKLIAEAIETVAPLRRCTAPARPGRSLRDGACSAAQLGVAACPCAGGASVEHYAAVVARVVRALTVEPDLVLEPLRERMASLARQERFEQAADVRDRAAALANALRRQRRLDALRRSGRVELRLRNGSGAELVAGRLARAWAPGELGLGAADGFAGLGDPADDPDVARPASPAVAAEVLAVASWLDANAARIEVVHAEGPLASVLPRLPTFVASA